MKTSELKILKLKQKLFYQKKKRDKNKNTQKYNTM